MNSKVIGDTMQKAAESIAGSAWWKKISGNGDLAGELAETISKNSKLGLDSYSMQREILDHVENRLGEEAAETVAKGFKPGISDPVKAVEKMVKSGSLDEKQAQMVQDVIKDAADKHKMTPEDMNILQKAANYPRAYFGVADKSTRNTRIATAAGAYATVAVGGRVLSGGSLTKDEYGRNDIAGIPFI